MFTDADSPTTGAMVLVRATGGFLPPPVPLVRSGLDGGEGAETDSS